MPDISGLYNDADRYIASKNYKGFINSYKAIKQFPGTTIDQLFGDEGITLLMSAAKHGQLKILKLLLRQGADPAIVSEKDGSTALTIAAGMYNNTEVIESILATNRVDVNHKDASGKSALQYAVDSCDYFSACALLDNGASASGITVGEVSSERSFRRDMIVQRLNERSANEEVSQQL